VNLDVAGSAIRVLRVLIMLWAGRLDGAYVMGHAVARQTQLIYGGVSQQARIGGSVRRMASRAAFGLHRCVFVNERALLVRVTLNAWGVSASRQSGLLKLKATVRIMAITTAHGAFQNFVMEG
jgi:hypothetical protein